MITNKLKKCLNIVIILLVFLIIINLCLWNKKNDAISVFNSFGIAIVMSESMEPELSKNDIIFIIKQDEYLINDIVVYQKDKELIVHRIIELADEMVITKGDANEKEDKPINSNNIYGKVKFKVPYFGLVISFLKSNYGIASVIILILFLFIYSCKKELDVMNKNNK